MGGQHETFGGPSWVSNLPDGPHCRSQSFGPDLLYNYFVTGEDDKADIFLFPAIHTGYFKHQDPLLCLRVTKRAFEQKTIASCMTIAIVKFQL